MELPKLLLELAIQPNWARRTLVREVTKNPKTTLTEPQSSLVEMGEPTGRMIVSAALHKSRLYGKVARWKPVRKRHVTTPRVCKKARERLQRLLWSDEIKIELSPECKVLHLAETEHSSSPI